MPEIKKLQDEAAAAASEKQTAAEAFVAHLAERSAFVKNAKRVRIAPNKLHVSPRNVRGKLDYGKIDELAAHLALVGWDETKTLVVRKDGDGFEAIIGNRRTMALGMMDESVRPKSVPCLVLPEETPESVIFEIMLDRSHDLPPSSTEAMVRTASRMEALGYTQAAIADALTPGQSRDKAQFWLKIASLPRNVREAVVESETARETGSDAMKAHVEAGKPVFNRATVNLLSKSWNAYNGTGQRKAAESLKPEELWPTLAEAALAGKASTQVEAAGPDRMKRGEIEKLRQTIVGNVSDEALRGALTATIDVILLKDGARMALTELLKL